MADEESTKKKGYLGVAIEQLDQRLQKDLNAEFGVVVSRVELDSPADNYGLTEDDVIQYVNEIKIRRPHTLTRIIRKINPGDEAKIQVIRDGKPQTIKVVIGEIKDKTDHAYSFSPEKEIATIIHRRTGVYLGVQLMDINQDIEPYFGVKPGEGLLILEVEKDSPAETGGLKSGDVLISIDGKKVSDREQVRDFIVEYEPGEEIQLNIIRQRKKMEITAQLKSQPAGEHLFLGAPGKQKNIFFMPEHQERKWLEYLPKMKRDLREKIEKEIHITPLRRTI